MITCSSLRGGYQGCRVFPGRQARYPSRAPPRAYHPLMSASATETIPDQAWSRAEIAGAVLLAVLAVGLGFIAADILIGGRVFKRGCCSDSEAAAGDS